MSMASPNAQSGSPPSTRPRRVLACVLCQQRKVKCDRRFPCANCVKSKAQCVPAPLIQRQRKRRFPERELLDRLRKYEGLLRQNNISFHALHGEAKQQERSPNNGAEQSDEDGSDDGRKEAPTPSDSTKSRGYKARNFWHAVSRGFRDGDNESDDSSEDDVREAAVRKAWEEMRDNGDHLLFGTRGLRVDLSLSHPSPVQILRLWQVYLDNVNPLLKVTHTPTLQGRVIEAVSNLNNIAPTLEALLFGIYCVAILSLTDDDCQTILGSSKEDSLSRNQIACQQALANCNFLRTSERDCLTALFLYLITTRHNTTPPIVSSLFGVAIRLGQRMGIHNEHTLAKCSVLEAEMRRRLWWSLVLFDSRIGELSHTKPVTLDPSWDCKLPLNVNDADLRLEMKTEPKEAAYPTEATYAVLRSEVGEFLRHAEFHLDFNCPGLKPLARRMSSSTAGEQSEAVRTEEILNEKYFKNFDEDNALHFMSLWSTRSALAKCRLLEHHARYSDQSTLQTDTLRNTATLIAIALLECDTKIMTSPLTKHFSWFNHFYFPFPAYIHIIQDLKRRPNSELSERAWEAMSDNHLPWLGPQFGMNTPFFSMFTKIVLEAWDVKKAANREEVEVVMPRIISSITKMIEEGAQTQDAGMGEAGIDTDMNLNDYQLPALTPMDQHQLNMGMMGLQGWPAMTPDMPHTMTGMPMNTHLIWPPFGVRPGWQ